MTRQTFTAVDFGGAPPTGHTAVANTTTRTNLWNAAKWTAIPAYDPQPGKLYHLRCGGVISTTGTPTLTITPTFGQSATPASNTSLGGTGAATLATLTGANWWAEFVLGIRSVGIGASGMACVGSGYITIGASATSAVTLAMGGTSVTTADDTAAAGLLLDATWSAASPSNTMQALWTVLQSLN